MCSASFHLYMSDQLFGVFFKENFKKIFHSISLPPLLPYLFFPKKNETKPVFKKFILHYLLLKGSVTLYFNKVEYHSPNNVWAKPDPIMCQVWLKLAQWFRRNRKCEKLTNGQTDGTIHRRA